MKWKNYEGLMALKLDRGGDTFARALKTWLGVILPSNNTVRVRNEQLRIHRRSIAAQLAPQSAAR